LFIQEGRLDALVDEELYKGSIIHLLGHLGCPSWMKHSILFFIVYLTGKLGMPSGMKNSTKKVPFIKRRPC
jgi:hypothetical protein